MISGKLVVFLLVIGSACALNNLGPCVEGACPGGYMCVNDICIDASYYCPNNYNVGACIANACPTGYDCISGTCCQSGKEAMCTSSNAFGACVLNMCPSGMQCIQGLCC